MKVMAIKQGNRQRFDDTYICDCCARSPCVCMDEECDRAQHLPITRSKSAFTRMLNKELYDCLPNCRVMVLKNEFSETVMVEFVHHDSKCPTHMARMHTLAALAKTFEIALKRMGGWK